MNINLYKTPETRDVIHKAKSSPYPLSINARADFDVINPEIRLNTASEQIDVRKYNYLEIVDLGRFYFIDSIEMVNNTIVRLLCSCDVLETYKDDILASSHQYRRNFKTGDKVGDGIEFGNDYDITTLSSSAGFDGEKTYVMTTIGGYATGGSE